MDDDTLTRDERAALDSLAREVTPPDGLEDRVAADLRAAGAFTPRRPRSRAWAVAVAAAVLLFAAGFATARMASRSDDSTTPRFLLLLYGGDTTSAADLAARVAEYGAWADAEEDAGRLVVAEKLDSGRLVLGPESRVPPADTEPSGFFLIRAESLDAARAAATSNPHLRYGGTIVIRPIDSR
jgi:hypothetical protein